jgi:hypothetical protein
MTDFNIPDGTIDTISNLGANSTNTVEGNSTAAYGAGGGTLNSTGPLPGTCNVTVTGGVFDVDGVANNDTITLNNSTLQITGGSWNPSTTINFGAGPSAVFAPAADATSPTLGGVQFTGMDSGDYISTGLSSPITNVSWSSGTLNFTQGGTNYAVAVTLAAGTTANFQAATVNGQSVIVNGSVVNAPVLSGGGNSVNYTPQGAAVAVDAGLGVSDTESATLVGATAAISAGFLAGDMLNFTNQNGIAGSYNASTGVLTLTGSASLAEYQAALESVTFSSTSNNPSNSGTDPWTAPLQ